MSADKPIGSNGGYNINWDEIDENTNPFGSKTLSVKNKTTNNLITPIPQEPIIKTADTISEHGVSDTGSSEPIHHLNVKSTSAAMGDSLSPRKDEINVIGSGPIKVDVLNKNQDELNVADISPSDELLDGILPGPAEVLEEDENDYGGPIGTEAAGASTAANIRRLSNSSAATFDLTPGNRSPVPLDDTGAVDSYLPANEELIHLRTENERLKTLVADMQRCIAEYEISLRHMAEEKARSAVTAKESVIDIIAERDQAIEEISTIEKAFGDLHGRFEKSKQIIDKFKQNEEVLKKTAEEYHAQMKRQEQKYQALKTHAEQKLMKVAEETEQLKRSNEDEMTRMRTALKRADVRIRGLESQLEQKFRENTELTKICDELLNKYDDKT